MPRFFRTARGTARILAPLALFTAAIALSGCGSTGLHGGGAPDGSGSVASPVASPVVGYWRIGNPSAACNTAQFCPQGSLRVLCGNRTRISGRFRVQGDRITIEDAGHAQPATYRYVVGDDALTIVPVDRTPPPAWMGRPGVAWHAMD